MLILRRRFVALAGAAAIVSGFAGCGVGSSTPADSVVLGDEITSVVAVDGEFVHTTIYRFHELESRDGVEAVVLLPHLHIVDDLRAGTRTKHTELLADIEHVSSFLQEHWDGHVGGHDDAGANSYEFMRYLRDNGISPRDFLQEYERAKAEGMTIGQFVSALDSVSRILPASSPDHFLNFLHHIGGGIKEFLAATRNCFPTFDDYLRAMGNQKLDFDALLERYNDSGDDVCGAVMPAQSSSAPDGKRIANLRAKRQGFLSSAKEELQITQRKWSCINSGKPDCGAVSAVLNIDDPSPFSYLHPREKRGREVTFKGRCHTWWLGFLKDYEVIVQPVVLYDARHPLHGGRYINEIRFEIHKIDNDSSCTIDASVHLNSLANAGLPDQPDPKVEVEFDLVLQKGHYNETTKHCTWIVQATSGVVDPPSCS